MTMKNLGLISVSPSNRLVQPAVRVAIPLIVLISSGINDHERPEYAPEGGQFSYPRYVQLLQTLAHSLLAPNVFFD